MKILQREMQVEDEEDFIFRGNGRDQNGQYRSGFTSTRDEGRRDIRLEMPPEPEPSRFSDWSSLGSPPTRTSPHSAPDVPIEPTDNTQNRLTVSSTSEVIQRETCSIECRNRSSKKQRGDK